MNYRSCQLSFAVAPDVHGTDPSGKPAESRHGDKRQGKPSRDPGNAYITVFALLGAALGGAVGFLVSRGIGGILIAILCVAGGALLGGSIGTLLGERLKTRMARRKHGPQREDIE
jgi:outer membrane lipoprotein SlyB